MVLPVVDNRFGGSAVTAVVDRPGQLQERAAAGRSIRRCPHDTGNLHRVSGGTLWRISDFELVTCLRLRDNAGLFQSAHVHTATSRRCCSQLSGFVYELMAKLSGRRFIGVVRSRFLADSDPLGSTL